MNQVHFIFFDLFLNFIFASRAPNGFYIAGSHIPQEPTLKLMTSTELTFAHMIETHLCKYSEPVYKQLVVELFCVLTAVLR